MMLHSLSKSEPKTHDYFKMGRFEIDVVNTGKSQYSNPGRFQILFQETIA